MSPNSNETTDGSGRTIEVEFSPDEYDRLVEMADDPAATVRDATMWRVDIAEAIAYTDAGEFTGPEGFVKLVEETTPTWPYGALAGLEAVAIDEGESRWAMDVGPEHANPMGTVHGGVLCDLGDAAMGTAYMSTVEPEESFTTVDLTANFLRPVRTERLEAVGRIVHRGRRVGLVECEITNEAGKLVASLSSTCLTLRD
jgi:uncharacterized protein (TIGR00369 family)